MTNRFGLSKDNLFFDRLHLQLNNYNLNYFKVVSGMDNKVFSENFSSFSLKAFKNMYNFDLSIDFEQKIKGNQLGNNFNIKLKREFYKNNWFSLSLSIRQKHPGFIYENFISGYDNFNWSQSLKLVENKQIDLKISNSVFGNINFNHSIIDNFFYLSVDKDSQEIMAPILNQYDRKIKYSSLKIKRSFNFGKWTFDNAIIYQIINQNEDILNLPKFMSEIHFFSVKEFSETL